MLTRQFLLLVALSQAAFCSEIGNARGDAVDVSLIQLIANPKEYHVKPVRVIGFLHLGFESDGLYLHREDYDRHISSNSVWIEAPPELKKGMQKMSDHYVLLEGVFSATDRGHMGMRSGAIKKVNRAMVWVEDEKKKEPIQQPQQQRP
jgi:hypothetical protein